MDNSKRQLDAAAAAVELDELEEPLDEPALAVSDDFFSDEELDSEELDPLLEPFDELLPDSRLSVR
ncbi:hypothetical protein AU184_14595 [Mycolicibacterium novocastrense]|nr:hypothetical protein AU183_10910 [Mycolicibacterium novocastrense]KUH78201.1 hypothetical protein AU072_09675 [Mycolicibacterium novocastrense]KUH79536.1 hypothetical protein AU184_14595 [Mycolicibacterium novocastrense]